MCSTFQLGCAGNLGLLRSLVLNLIRRMQKLPRPLDLCTTETNDIKKHFRSRILMIKCAYQDLDVPILIPIGEE